jgi:Putative MetA-pathway of phenol degradation
VPLLTYSFTLACGSQSSMQSLGSLLRRALRPTLCAVALAVCSLHSARAQQLEPRSYSNAPIGLNFLIAAYTYSWGDVLLDPTVPIANANAKVNSVALGYSRFLDFWGESGTIAVVLPYAWVSANGDVEGQPQSIDRAGFADLAVRLSVNLYGAPALSPREFRDYHQDTIVGVSLLATAPTGEYYPTKLINIGANRWSFKPEVGVSKALGPWTLEGAFGVTFFTDNNEFYPGNKVRQQDPLYAVQVHVIYNFNPKLWGALDATYYAGGRTSVNGGPNDDLQQNSRWGATLAQSLNRRNSIKLYFTSGATARTGTDFTTVGIAWQYRWGAGL